jgi:hypothetical protein
LNPPKSLPFQILIFWQNSTSEKTADGHYINPMAGFTKGSFDQMGGVT